MVKAPSLVNSDCERAPSDSCPARWPVQPAEGLIHAIHTLLSRAMVHWTLGQSLLLGLSIEPVQGPRPLLPLHTVSLAQHLILVHSTFLVHDAT